MSRWVVALGLCLLIACSPLAAQEVGSRSVCDCGGVDCDDSGSWFVGRQWQIVDGEDPIWHVVEVDLFSIAEVAGSSTLDQRLYLAHRLMLVLLRGVGLTDEPELPRKNERRNPPAL